MGKTCYVNIFHWKDGAKDITIEYYRQDGSVKKEEIFVDIGDEIEINVRG